MVKILNLDGEWLCSRHDGMRGVVDWGHDKSINPQKYIRAQVPGEIHLDLIRAGQIPNPYISSNILAARWVEECMWYYRRSFNAPTASLKEKSWLVFDCLDCAAEIFLNGEKIGAHNNFFTPCRIETTGKLKAGKNILVVALDGGLFYAADKPADGFSMQGFDNKLHKRHWLRKPQFEAGWDWAGRLLNVGIQGSVRLEWTKEAVRVEDIWIYTQTDATLKMAFVHVHAQLENYSGQICDCSLIASVASRQSPVTARIAVPPGSSTHKMSLPIENPALWWPVGHGPQTLHDVTVNVRFQNKSLKEKKIRVGFRHVRINQDISPEQANPDGFQSMYSRRTPENYQPEKGRLFVMEINGRKIFCKGSNVVPADMIISRITPEKSRRLVRLALDANFNMLRVWGGGIYETDAFYDECDRLGLLVWQDFIFACAKYPAHERSFLDNVTQEVRWQSRRLSCHPSLAVWCGNNEVEWAAQWEPCHAAKNPHIDHALYHHVIPTILKQEDPSRYYQPSSPYSPDHLHACMDECGDQHPWSVGFTNLDFRDYRKMDCRFPNEGGFLGPSSLPGVLSCLGAKQKFIGSHDWQAHDNSIASMGGNHSYTDNITDFWLGKPLETMSLADYVYWGGLIQGEALSEYIGNFRRRAFGNAAAIFWMFNDCWPCTRSWSILDHKLRRTPSYYPVKRSFSPIHVVLAEEKNSIALYAINDTPRTIPMTVEYGVFNFSGEYPIRHIAQAMVGPNQSARITSFQSSRWKNKKASAAYAIARDFKGKTLARNRLILPLWKEMRWPRPQIKVSMQKGFATFLSPQFAMGVCVDLDGKKRLSDNFFDLYPGIPHQIGWQEPHPPAILHTGNLI